MSSPGLPEVPAPEALAGLEWSDIEALYRALVEFPLDSASLRAWLACWSSLDENLYAADALVYIAHTADTRDATREAAYLRWATETQPPRRRMRVELGRTFVPFAAEVPELQLFARGLEVDDAIYRSENLPRMAELTELETAYRRGTGGLTVEWSGTRQPVPALARYLLDRDRTIRERAFRASAGAYLARRDELAAVFDRMVHVRHDLAREAGFRSYRDYAFAEKHRFDYGPDDCLRLHAAIESGVLPVVARLHAMRRERLGAETLRPWDLQVSPLRDTPLVPFQNVDEFLAGTTRICDAVDGEIGGFFRTLITEHMLDVENREGKAPGAYSYAPGRCGLAFIFMNAIGVHDDVNTLLHETGHAFHWHASRGIPYVWARLAGQEAAELASMSMELLGARHLARPVGFYSARDAADAEIQRLESTLMLLPHVACIDAFQHWAYGDGVDATPLERDAQWLALSARFEPTVDYRGIEAERTARWYRQAHIYTLPFYMIEYAFAGLGAIQVWSQSRPDPGEAVRRYKQALSYGGVRPMAEMYAAAGARLVFDHASIATLASTVEARIAELVE